MLTRLRRDHRGVTRCYRYDLDLDVTLERHRTKPLAAEVTEGTVQSWYRPSDPVAELGETAFGPDVSVDLALRTILADVGWTARPIGSHAPDTRPAGPP
ncbi:hypothetical protein [Pseudactinotalea suaedae]|uniref:hypothetical protein n=1 Tax=Pseudactinotalea suaedae TaxID=1524924 RepID=UPI0012E2C07C|nr:hypothetical protein [Pseudactinotalea suaedae]